MFSVLLIVVPRERILWLRGNAECENKNAIDLLDDFGLVDLELF